MRFVALDFETANERRDSACALGIAKVVGSRVVERKSWLIRPPRLKFNRRNIDIHGITAADVKDKPKFNELWPTIRRHLDGELLLAHNASFDFSVLRHVLDSVGPCADRAPSARVRAGRPTGREILRNAVEPLPCRRRRGVARGVPVHVSVDVDIRPAIARGHYAEQHADH